MEVPGENAKLEGSLLTQGCTPRGLPVTFNPALCGSSACLVRRPSFAYVVAMPLMEANVSCADNSPWCLGWPLKLSGQS